MGGETLPSPAQKFLKKVLAQFDSMVYNSVNERQERKETTMWFEFTIYTRTGVEHRCNRDFQTADEALLIAGEMFEAMAAMDSELLCTDFKVRFYRSSNGKYQAMEKCYYPGITNESKFVIYLREGEK